MDDILEYLSNVLGEFNYKKLIFPTILLILLIGSFTYLFFTIKNIERKTENISENKVEEKIDKNENEIPEYIYVDVKGEVANPGVYKLNIGSRVIDAVKESGGVTKKANTRFINLSKLLNDGDVIVVYSTEEIENAKKENIVYIETPCVCEEVKNDACYKDVDEESDNNSQTTNTKININNDQVIFVKPLT